MSEPKFKVGDRVRALETRKRADSIEEREIYVVVYVAGGAILLMGQTYPWDESYFEPAEPTDAYHGKKHDAGKSRMDLLPWAALMGVGRVLEYGCRKYAEDSWQTVPDARKRYTAAMLRHLAALESGETHDAESELHHASHMACNALFVCWLWLRGTK